MAVTPTLQSDVLRRQDPEVADILLGEISRQSTTLQLTAAEDFTSPAVLAALGSPLANKYAEGWPCWRPWCGKRRTRGRHVKKYGISPVDFRRIPGDEGPARAVHGHTCNHFRYP